MCYHPLRSQLVIIRARLAVDVHAYPHTRICACNNYTCIQMYFTHTCVTILLGRDSSSLVRASWCVYIHIRIHAYAHAIITHVYIYITFIHALPSAYITTRHHPCASCCRCIYIFAYTHMRMQQLHMYTYTYIISTHATILLGRDSSSLLSDSWWW